MSYEELVRFLRGVHERPGGTGAILNLIRGAKLHGATDLAILGDLVTEPDLRLELTRHGLQASHHAYQLLRRMQELDCPPVRLTPELDRVAGLFACCRARNVRDVHRERGDLGDVEVLELLGVVFVAEEDAVLKLAANRETLTGDAETRAVVVDILEDDGRHVAALQRRLGRFEERFPRRVITRTVERLRGVLRELDVGYYGALDDYFARVAQAARAA